MSFNFGDLIAGLRSGVFIKSVQYGTVAVTARNLTATATISSVNVNKSMLAYLGENNDDSNAPSASGVAITGSRGRITLTNGTTVTINRGDPATNCTVTISFVVTEYF